MATRNDKLEFLESIAEMATALGVSLAVEKLMPAVHWIVIKNPISGEEGNVKNLVFRQTGALFEFFSTSNLSAGYLGLTDFLIPLYEEFFCQELMNPIADQVKTEVQRKVIGELKKITNILTEADKSDKIIPIILENLKDDQDEEKRIQGLELLTELAPVLGKSICENYLMYEIVSL